MVLPSAAYPAARCLTAKTRVECSRGSGGRQWRCGRLRGAPGPFARQPRNESGREPLLATPFLNMFTYYLGLCYTVVSPGSNQDALYEVKAVPKYFRATL